LNRTSALGFITPQTDLFSSYFDSYNSILPRNQFDNIKIKDRSRSTTRLLVRRGTTTSQIC